MNFVRFHDLDLPVFTGLDAQDMYIARTKAALEVAGEIATQDYLLRPMDIEGPESFNLARILRETTSELEMLTDASDVSLVEYQWGLAPRSVLFRPYRLTPRSRHDELVPKGFCLAAKVKVLHGADGADAWEPDRWEPARKAVERYDDRVSSVKIRDAHEWQFVVHEDRVTYVDPEPRLARR